MVYYSIPGSIVDSMVQVWYLVKTIDHGEIPELQERKQCLFEGVRIVGALHSVVR